LPKILIVGSIAGSLVGFRGDLIKEWLKRGFTVMALSRPAGEMRQRKIHELGAEYRPIPLYRDGINPFQDLRLFFSLYGIIRKEKPAYIFAYTAKPIIYSALSSRMAHITKLFAMITGLGYAFAGNSLKQKLVKVVLRLMYGRALKRCEVVFFQNQDDLVLFKELRIISNNQKVVMVNGSGVNLSHFYYSKPLVNKDLNFLLIGRLLKGKGIKEYVEAAELIKAKYPDVKFKLLGRLLNSPDSIDAEDLSGWQSRGIIEYLGGKIDVRPYLEECSVYVLPSYREGTPRSVLEAMAMGRPIITTDAPGCRETVREGLNGFLVPIKDSTALAGAMERFITEPWLIDQMGKESRKIAEDKFDVRKVNKVIMEAMGLGQ
jgi:glycosyltransferase involved in cell wall biosynthesis